MRGKTAYSVVPDGGYIVGRKMKKGLHKLLAGVLSIAMVLTGITIPAKTVEAAETISGTDVITESDNGVYLTYTSTLKFEANCWGEGSPAVDLYEYSFAIHNTTAEKISDWSVTITPNSAYYWNSGWNGVTNDTSTDSIKIGTYKGVGDDGETWSTTEIAAGGTQTGMGCQCGGDLFEGAMLKLTYQIGGSTAGADVDDTVADPSVIGSQSDQVTATCTKGSSSSGEYHEYFLQVNNHSSESIGDWIVAIPMTGIAETQDWSSWAKVQAYYTAEYLYIVPVGSAVISANGSFGAASDNSYKFNYKSSSDISGAVVYYKTGTASTGAFDAVINHCSGGSSSGGGGSSSGGETFDGSNIGSIDTSLDYNFAKLLQYSLYFYDANMCGDRVSETSLYSKDLYNGWRGDCHVNDYFTYNGTKYNAVGGFHDAGDHVKFGMPANESFITLGLGYLEFGQAFDELGQKEHLKTIVDYYCTYLKNCTVLDSTGVAAEAFCYQIGCGQKDHESWVAPEVEDESSTNRTYSLVATSSNPATEYVAGAAATLAINYLNFGNAEDLTYAKALFAMAKNNAKSTGSTDTSGSFYHSGSWEDEYCLAAAMLYKITGDRTYATEYNNNNANFSNIQKPNGWCNLYQFASYYAPTKNETEWNTINSWLASQANSSTSSYYAGDDSWGTARINCNVQFSALLYDKLNHVDTYAAWCRYQMSTILGNNSTGKNLVCGYNTNSPTKPHHRAASGYAGWTEFNNNVTQKYTLYGALVGGPASSDFSTYNDAVNDAVSNEVTLDYNAGLVGSAAALYLLYKDTTDEGFTNQTVNADFYGGSNFTPAGEESDTPAADLTASVEKLEIASLEYGYRTSGSGSVIIHNAGNAAAASVRVALEKGSGSAFETTGNLSGSLSAGGDATVTVAAKSGLGAGDYTDHLIITYNSNKTLTIPVSVTVTQRAITVKAEDKNKTYGEENPTLTYSVTSGEVVSGESLHVTLDTTAETTSDAGDYDITVASGSNPNYAITAEKGTLTIGQKAVSCEEILFPTPSDLTVGDALSQSVLTGGSTEYGDFAWETPADIPAKGNQSKNVVLTLHEKTKKNYSFEGEEYNASAGTITRAITVVVKKAANPETPEQPAGFIRTKTTIRMTAIEGYEYSKDGGESWQASNLFTGLSPFTEYDMCQRIKATDHYEASKTSDVFPIYTLVSDPYTIDLSKLNDVNYVYAILDEEAGATIRYNGQELILTMSETEHPKGYVITGSAPDVSIKVSVDSKITLRNATVHAIVLDAASEVEIVAAGTNQVTDGITCATSTDVTFHGEGTLHTSTITTGGNICISDVQITATSSIAGKKVQISGGTVTVTGGDNASAIIADEVVITGGDVTATGGSGASAIVGKSEVKLTGGTITPVSGGDKPAIKTSEDESSRIVLGSDVTVNGDAENMFSKNPVDESGNTRKPGSVSNTVEEEQEEESEIEDEEPEIKATAMKISAKVKGVSDISVKSTYLLAPKKTMTLKVSFFPANAEKEKVTFTSSNPEVATVKPDGKITAKKAGTTTFTIKSERGLEKTFRVKVVKKAITKIRLKGSKTMKVQKKQKLKVTLSPNKKYVSTGLVWKTSNKKIATVSSTGQVKALRKGRVKITAIATDGSGKKASFTIRVKK